MTEEIYTKVSENLDAIPFPARMTEDARETYHSACLTVYAANDVTESEYLSELEKRL